MSSSQVQSPALKVLLLFVPWYSLSEKGDMDALLRSEYSIVACSQHLPVMSAHINCRSL